MDISLFIEFSMIVKHGNLSEAARELHTTQPALSRHLSIIEKEVGAQLLDRSKSPMELTYVGERFLEKSAVIANEYHRLITFVDEIKSRNPIRVRVSGLFDSSVSTLLRKAKRAVETDNPGIEIRFVSPPFQTPFDLIRQHELEISIEPISTMIDTRNLESLHLGSENPFVVMEADSPLAEREFFDARDLSSLEFTSLRSNRDHAMRKHLQNICLYHKIEGTIPKGLLLSSAESYSNLFLCGLGDHVLLLPESMAKKYTSNSEWGYVARPFLGEASIYDIRAFYLEDPTREVQIFIDALRVVASAASLNSTER